MLEEILPKSCEGIVIHLHIWNIYAQHTEAYVHQCVYLPKPYKVDSFFF